MKRVQGSPSDAFQLPVPTRHPKYYILGGDLIFLVSLQRNSQVIGFLFSFFIQSRLKMSCSECTDIFSNENLNTLLANYPRQHSLGSNFKALKTQMQSFLTTLLRNNLRPSFGFFIIRKPNQLFLRPRCTKYISLDDILLTTPRLLTGK